MGKIAKKELLDTIYEQNDLEMQEIEKNRDFLNDGFKNQSLSSEQMIAMQQLKIDELENELRRAKDEMENWKDLYKKLYADFEQSSKKRRWFGR